MVKERERDILVRKVNGQQIEAGACLPITVTLISAKLPHRLEMSFGTPPQLLLGKAVQCTVGLGEFKND